MEPKERLRALRLPNMGIGNTHGYNEWYEYAPLWQL